MGDDDVMGVDDGRVSTVSESCSVCLDMVTDNGGRSWAKLQCGHQFHLDCIGSAFNSKGAMQCPNCRQVEKGRWLYASGSRSLPDFIVDDWADEFVHDLSYSEMSLGVQLCPFSGVRLHGRFEEDEYSSIAYGSSFDSHQSGPSVPNQSISTVTRTRNSFDAPRPGMHHFIAENSSASTAPSAVTSPIIPPFAGTASQSSDHSSAPAYFQPSTGNPAARNPVISNRQRPRNHRGLAEVGTYAPSSNHSGYYFPHHQASFQIGRVDRDAFWVPLNAPFAATSETGTRASSNYQRLQRHVTPF